MTPDEAAWVRANAFTPLMRKTFREVPGLYATCDCQGGLTSWCQGGQCGNCHRATPQTGPETFVCGRGGESPRYFAEPYEHESLLESLDLGPCTVAAVWLADRTCRWICPCPCHGAPAGPEQLDLFAGAAA